MKKTSMMIVCVLMSVLVLTLVNAAVADINHNLDALSTQSEQTSRLFNESMQATKAIDSEMDGLKVKVKQFKGV